MLLDVDHTMECMTEETFGPTLPIMKVGDAEQALELANDSPYGLQASVWTKDTARGESIAERHRGRGGERERAPGELPGAGDARWAAGRPRASGSRHGQDGIRKYARKQSSVVTRFGPKKELFMFPYTKRGSKIIGGALKLLHGRGKRP